VRIIEFEDFVRGRSTALLRTAYLLVGDRGHAEDLLQEVLERAARRWDRIHVSPEAYVRKALVNAAMNRRRRLRVHEAALDDHDLAIADLTDRVDLRHALLQGLGQLPARQRAVLVCRYFDDLTEAQTAAVMGISIGTVKSTASRALDRLCGLVPTLSRSAL
jgi:RNA polymerase sigma-70 factor (sigma-E family)